MQFPVNKRSEGFPGHKEDVIVIVQHKELSSEKYITGGYYDADINNWVAYGFEDDQDMTVTHWQDPCQELTDIIK